MNQVTINGKAVKNLSLINPADWGFTWLGDPNSKTISTAEAYRDVGWFRSAVDTRANAVIGTPWEISRSDEVVWDGSGEPPAGLEAFADISSTFFRAELSLLHAQGAWFLKVSSTGRGIERLQYLAPDTIEPIVSKSGLLGWGRYVDNVMTDKFAPEDVLYISVPNPFQELPVKKEERMGEAKAALVHADILFELDRFARGELKRGLIKPVVVEVPPGTPEKEKARIVSWFKRKFGGAKNAGNVGVIEADGAVLHILGGGLSDLQAKELIETHRQGVCTALRVPYSMLQTQGAANRSVSEQATRDFIERVVTPDLRRIERAMNEQVFSPLGFELTFHPERLEMFQSAELDKSDKVATLWQSGLVTRNEAREPIDGLDPLEGDMGDEFYVAPTPIAFPTNGKSKIHQLRPFSSG